MAHPGNLRIFDGYAHRRMRISVLGAGRVVKTGEVLVYVRRSEDGPFYGYLHDLFGQVPGQGGQGGQNEWSPKSAYKSLVTHLCSAPVGTVARPANRSPVEVISPIEALSVIDGPVLVVRAPVDGWGWQRPGEDGGNRLSESERACVAYNSGQSSTPR